jgi:hypothetical protein
MAGFDLTSIHSTILSFVESEMSDYEVYEDYVLNEQELQRVDKRVKPYIVISWFGISRQGNNASIAGVRKDEYASGFDIGVIAPTPKQCRLAMNIIIDKLIGYSFDGGNAYLTPGTSSGAFVAAEREGVPHLYMAMSDFGFPINYDSPGAPMTPPSS